MTNIGPFGLQIDLNDRQNKNKVHIFKVVDPIFAWAIMGDYGLMAQKSPWKVRY